MQTRTRAPTQRPLPTTLSTASTAPLRTPVCPPPSPSAQTTPTNPRRHHLRTSNTYSGPHNPSTSSSNNNTTIHNSGGGGGGSSAHPPVAPLTADLLSRSLPAPPRSARTHTPALTPDHRRPLHSADRTPHSARSHATASSGVGALDVVRMPAIASPSARTPHSTTTSPMQQQPQQQSHHSTPMTSPHAGTDPAAVATCVTRPPRLRSLSDPSSDTEAQHAEVVKHHVDDHRDEPQGEGSPEYMSDAGRPRREDLMARRRSSNSSARLPTMLQPNKLASVPCATEPSSVLTSPARMASQPDMNVLSVTSPARRGCLTAGGGSGAAEGNTTLNNNNNNNNGSNSSQDSSGSGDRVGGGMHAEKRTSGSVPSEKMPIPSPPPPPPSAPLSGTSAASMRPDAESARTDGSAARDSSRVRSLVNQLYQHVLDVQPEDPLRYLAYCNPRSLPPSAQATNRTTNNDNGDSDSAPPDGVKAAEDGVRVDVNDRDGEGEDFVVDMDVCGTGRNSTNRSNSTSPPGPTSDTQTTTTTAVLPIDAPAEPVTQPEVQRPPVGRAQRHSAANVNNTTNNNNTSSGNGGESSGAGVVVVATRGRSSPVLFRHSRPGSLDSRDGDISRSANTVHHSAPITDTVSSAPTTQPPVTTTTSGSGSAARVMRAPPSAPTTSLVARLTSAGSPATATHLRSTLSSGSVNGKLTSPFYLQRPPLGMSTVHSTSSGHNNNNTTTTTTNANTLLSSHGSRGMLHQTSFVCSLSGMEQRGEATPNDASSLFSTNSVDLQEFIAEFRLAKEECCGGGLDCPAISLDDLANIMDNVSFPFNDAALLLDLFEELLPCARYVNMSVAALSADAALCEQTPAQNSSGRALQDAYPTTPATPDSEARLTSAFAAPESMTTASLHPTKGGSSTTNTTSHLQAGRATNSAVTPVAEAATAATATTDAAPLSLNAVLERVDGLRVSGALADAALWTPAVKALLASSPSAAEGYKAAHLHPNPNSNNNSSHSNNNSAATIPSPPQATRVARGATSATGGPAVSKHNNNTIAVSKVSEGEDSVPQGSADVPTVPFDTYVARMAYKIQGRYSAEAIRIAFYSMVVDGHDDDEDDDEATGQGGSGDGADRDRDAEESADDGGVAGSVTQGNSTADLTHMPGGPSGSLYRRCADYTAAMLSPLPNAVSCDSLAPSEPAAGTAASTLTTATTTVNYGGGGVRSCTVPLLRCIAEGLLARLGMVDVTASELQRGLRSAGMPLHRDEQRRWECHVEDFARLVRAVSATADRDFSVSPANFCLSSLRDTTLQRGTSTTSWKEDSTSTSGRAGNAPPVHTIRYL